MSGAGDRFGLYMSIICNRKLNQKRDKRRELRNISQLQGIYKKFQILHRETKTEVIEKIIFRH